MRTVPPEAAPLRWSTTYDEPARAVVRVVGELESSTAAGLRGHLEEILERPLASVVLDVGGLTFLDAAGYGMLCDFGARCARVGVTAVLDPLPPSVGILVRILGMPDGFGANGKSG